MTTFLGQLNAADRNNFFFITIDESNAFVELSALELLLDQHQKTDTKHPSFKLHSQVFI